MITKLAGAAGVCLSLMVLAPQALAQPAKAPPRTVEDILAVLDQYKPDHAEVQRLTALVASQPPAGADARALARFHYARAQAAQKLGRVSQQIADFREVLRDEKAADMDIGQVYSALAQAEARGGRPATAIKTIQAAVAGYSTLNTRGRTISLLGDQIALQREIGDLPGVDATMFTLFSNYMSIANQPGSGSMGMVWRQQLDFARGVQLLAQGKYAAAESAFRASMRMYSPERSRWANASLQGIGRGQEFEWIEVLHDQKLTYLSEAQARQGRLGEAELTAREVLRRSLGRAGRNSAYTAERIVQLASVVSEQGRYREAGLLASAALDSLRESGTEPGSIAYVRARRALARALAAQKRWAEADAAFAAMRDGLGGDAALAAAGLSDPLWGLTLVRTGKQSQAVPMLRELAARDERILGAEAFAALLSRGFYALALAASGERAQALAEFRRAVPGLLEQSRAERGSESDGGARSLQVTEILEGYLVLLGEVSARGEAADAAAEAFRIADAARGSAVQRSLSASATRASVRDPQLAALARDEQDAQTRISVLSDTLERLLAAPPEEQLPKVVEQMRKDLEATKARRATLMAEIKRRFPEYANLVDPQPATVAEVQAALGADEALVALYVTGERTLVWAIPKAGAPAFTVAALGRAASDEAVAKLRKALDIGDVPLRGFPAYDTALSHELYSKLLRPVEAGWKGASRLLVAPHGSLGQLPFALLVTEPHARPATEAVLFESYRQVPWLLRRASITQLPSVSSLVTLRRVAAARTPARPFIGFGDPVFSRQQVAQAATTRGIGLRNLSIAKVAAPAAAAEGAPAPAAPAVANSSSLAQLAPLPDTSQEIREIAQALGADPQKDVFLGPRASERSVKEANLAEHRIVVFATHGLVPGDLDGLTQPALALSSPEVTGNKDDDGLLAMDEILGLRLNADWVVLSACNTASADGAGTEAVSGLGRAFFYAGARSLLVSNWPVETVSARLLTTGLFKAQAADPALPRAEALRRTMLALIDGPGSNEAGGYSYAHPMFWAPFTLVGDGGR